MELSWVWQGTKRGKVYQIVPLTFGRARIIEMEAKPLIKWPDITNNW